MLGNGADGKGFTNVGLRVLFGEYFEEQYDGFFYILITSKSEQTNIRIRHKSQ